MIRKLTACLLAVLFAFCALTGCAGDPGETPGGQNGAAEERRAVDVDLTVLSSTMVYSEVYNMLTEPERYVGKTVRMSGKFVIYANQDKTQYYPAVVIADATACCSQGMEFLLAGEPPYPEGYPALQSGITVSGVFETYDEDGVMYCHLVNCVRE